MRKHVGLKKLPLCGEKPYIRTMCKSYLPFSAGDDKIMPEDRDSPLF